MAPVNNFEHCNYWTRFGILFTCPWYRGGDERFCMTLSWVWGTYPASQCRYVADNCNKFRLQLIIDEIEHNVNACSELCFLRVIFLKRKIKTVLSCALLLVFIWLKWLFFRFSSPRHGGISPPSRGKVGNDWSTRSKTTLRIKRVGPLGSNGAPLLGSHSPGTPVFTHFTSARQRYVHMTCHEKQKLNLKGNRDGYKKEIKIQIIHPTLNE